MGKICLKGLGVALITPFRKDKSIDFNALSRLIDFQIENGADYLVTLGTTAETATLDEDEKAQIMRTVVEKVKGRVPIVVGMGGNNTAKVQQTILRSDFSGVSAILSVVPYYNKPSQEGIYQHFKAVTDVSPLPVILYNVPGRTGVNMTAETTLRIARTCPKAVAIKEASGNMEQIKTIIAGAPEGFSVISGDDAITTAVIQAGGVGVISVFANGFPKEMAWLVDSALRGTPEAARDKMNESYDKLFRLLMVDGNPAGVKCMLEMMGFVENELRLPLVPVCEETRKGIREELNKFAKK
ncbi:MAG: 4-hydroxy-tetrahydrodipicolinate synthase [Dysgonamonadaceae bacterium]|jgi:4-hydroxy-tetrahydrodipicolinate synthase|nr:4-hydroxy-tetrahydrodipicolinate synthase [Dysgonamonadaceae bacterium]